MSESWDWRMDGWDYGDESEPFFKVEFRNGNKKVINLEDLYAGYDVDTFEPWDDLPAPWAELFEETWADCTAAFGELEMYHFDSDTNPCRWRPQSELDALYEHAKTHRLASVERYADDEDA